MAGHGGPTYNVCGIDIAAVTPGAAAQRIVAAAETRQRLEVHLCNAYTLSLVDSDEELRGALQRDALNLPDGTPVAWLGRRRGTSGPVRGPGLVGDVVEVGRSKGVRHFFYGASPGVAETMARNLCDRYPGALVAGVESPPFGTLSDVDVKLAAERIREAEADVLWIGLGTPRQDYLVPRIAPLLDLPVIPVGAAFDFWAGNVAEAPKWLQGTGLEWVHRLASEPRRLWRRYLIGNPRFVRLAIRHRLAR
jgi:N-acetylglucosaminyldiphosphoundecaprenol N-acetyl-beta-D-mannosaminyltransferase